MFNRNDSPSEFPVQVEDAKKSGKKGKAMAKGGKITKATNMAVVPPHETSVPASKNAAKKVAIKKQRMS